MKKTCTKCGTEYPATAKFFSKRPASKDGLRCQCRKCRNKTHKKYQQTEKGKETHRRDSIKYYWRHVEKRQTYNKQYYQTFGGYLRAIFSVMKSRCNNPKIKGYENYGGRGIRCKFASAAVFIDYVVNKLGITNIDQIKGLDLDRINNNGNYEPGNIRWITHKENCNNRRKRRKRCG